MESASATEMAMPRLWARLTSMTMRLPPRMAVSPHGGQQSWSGGHLFWPDVPRQRRAHHQEHEGEPAPEAERNQPQGGQRYMSCR